MVTKQKRRLERRVFRACPCVAYIRLTTECVKVLVGVQNSQQENMSPVSSNLWKTITSTKRNNQTNKIYNCLHHLTRPMCIWSLMIVKNWNVDIPEPKLH